MVIVNLKISQIYGKTLYNSNGTKKEVIEIKLDTVKNPIGTRAMFYRGTQVMNEKGELVNIEDLKKGDIVKAVIGV